MYIYIYTYICVYIFFLAYLSLNFFWEMISSKNHIIVLTYKAFPVFVHKYTCTNTCVHNFWACTCMCMSMCMHVLTHTKIMYNSLPHPCHYLFSRSVFSSQYLLLWLVNVEVWSFAVYCNAKCGPPRAGWPRYPHVDPHVDPSDTMGPCHQVISD